MKKNITQFDQLINKLLNETNVAGGTGGTFSAYSNTPANVGVHGGSFGPTNNDFYGTGDARLPKVLTKMQRRTFPEMINNLNGKKKKKKTKKTSKNG